MPAAKIMLIRHAEKPDGDGAPGLMPNGAENPGAHPDRMEAGQCSGRPVQSRRWRPAETAARKAHESVRLGIGKPAAEADACAARDSAQSLDQDLSEGTPELVAAVKAAQDPVLISWQHEALPAIAGLIRGGSDGVPPTWPDHVYDLVWVFDLQASGAWSFTQMPELVMPGDSDNVIGLGG
jgi:hypothetical protein